MAVRLRHDQAYRTEYQVATLASGIERGQRVQQGQVIGFNDALIDTTVHYAVLVNERFIDPMRVRLPAEKQLLGQEFVDFRKEADRIATLVQREAPFHTIYAPLAK